MIYPVPRPTLLLTYAVETFLLALPTTYWPFQSNFEEPTLTMVRLLSTWFFFHWFFFLCKLWLHLCGLCYSIAGWSLDIFCTSEVEQANENGSAAELSQTCIRTMRSEGLNWWIQRGTWRYYCLYSKRWGKTNSKPVSGPFTWLQSRRHLSCWRWYSWTK